MGWIAEAAVNWFWIEFVERMSKGRPWWVYAFWILSPLLLLGILIAAAWILLR